MNVLLGLESSSCFLFLIIRVFIRFKSLMLMGSLPNRLVLLESLPTNSLPTNRLVLLESLLLLGSLLNRRILKRQLVLKRLLVSLDVEAKLDVLLVHVFVV